MRRPIWTSGRERFTRAGTVCLLALAALLSGPVAVNAQQDRIDRLREAYSAEAMELIQAIVTEARNSGVPVAPLYNKALEGAAKRIPADRVVPALAEFAGRMRQARELIGPAAQAAWLVAGADALRRGVSPELVAAIGREAEDRTPMALLIVGDLLEAGIPHDRALEVLREALARTRGEEALRDVPTTIRRLMRQGSLPHDAARDVLDAMRRGTPLDRLRHRRRPPNVLLHRPRPVPPGSEPTRDAARHDAQRTRIGGG